MGGGCMKIKFNGMLEKVKKGCNCKKQGNSEYGFVSQKMFILPSNTTRTFTVGKAEEVNKLDAEFLLSYRYKDTNGLWREVFSKVD